MITIVSGLPRSGTSLVMQMLAAGGYPILSDGERAADTDNPRGYFEYEKVKSLERDSNWLDAAEGHAVKVISFLLRALPANRCYRVIFVRRDLDEVLRSQAMMLERRGDPPGPPAAVMRAHFERHLHTLERWLAQQPHFRVLDCPHAQVLQDPTAAARRISEFLDAPLPIAAMAYTVDPALHRQRSFAR